MWLSLIYSQEPEAVCLLLCYRLIIVKEGLEIWYPLVLLVLFPTAAYVYDFAGVVFGFLIAANMLS